MIMPTKSIASLKITNCQKCPFWEERYINTGDSLDSPAFDWFCKKKRGKKIVGYVEGSREANAVPIPDWCPLLEK